MTLTEFGDEGKNIFLKGCFFLRLQIQLKSSFLFDKIKIFLYNNTVLSTYNPTFFLSKRGVYYN